jgi:hypothetical protein
MCQVQVVQKWDGISKISLQTLYNKFLAYLIDQGSKVLKQKHQRQQHNLQQLLQASPNNFNINGENAPTFLSEKAKSAYMARKKLRSMKANKRSIKWIDKLLQIPVADHRKYCIWRIIAPYLCNVKHLSFDQAFNLADKWLCKCNRLNPLDFDIGSKLTDCLNNAINMGYYPISFDNPKKKPKTLKVDNKELYLILSNNNCVKKK